MSRKKKTLLGLFCIALFAIAVSAYGQVRVDLKKSEPPPPASQDRFRIPEPNLPGTPEEISWWKELRDTGNSVLSSRGDKKASKKFLELLNDGQSKSYAPPVADRHPVVLYKTQPGYSEEARRQRVTGRITMHVELLPNGSIGEVKLMNRLGAGLDEKAVEAARKTIFLPAIKDRKFAPFWLYLEMMFSIY
jgi:TonB family protein